MPGFLILLSSPPDNVNLCYYKLKGTVKEKLKGESQELIETY